MSENIPQFGEYAPTPPVAAPQAPVAPAPQFAATPPPYTTGPVYYEAAGAAPRKPGLGIAALILASVVFVASTIWAVANGVAAGSIPGLLDGTFEDGFNAGYEAGSTEQGAAFGLGVVLHVVLGTMAGVAALVMGIVAIALKRGRPQGIAATAIAVAAPVISYVAYSVAAAASLF